MAGVPRTFTCPGNPSYVTMEEEENKQEDISSECIVVWAGVIARYTAIKNFTDDGDPIRLATKEELEEYHKHKNNCKP